uniref:Vitamin K-dependent gamma-carboxylase lumenal domain-containing protein n=1 Tax=Ciona savignyi TaxID=51511 RepID=H2YP31_CIOSA
MMVHSFQNQHIKITYRDKHGVEGFLKPGAFLNSRRSRWSAHPDMLVQYSRCLKQKLMDLGVEQPSIYIDVWKSMNGRFQQRMYDPNTDLANYDWSPYQTPNFTLPVLSELSNWREKLKELKKLYRNASHSIVFVADFPGMHLENYVHEDLGNTTISVLRGQVLVEFNSTHNLTVSTGESIKVPSGQFHKVHTISNATSCYFYVYLNATEMSLREKLSSFTTEQTSSKSQDPVLTLMNSEQISSSELEDPQIIELYQQQEAKKVLEHESKNRPVVERTFNFLFRKIATFRRSFLLSYYSCRNLMVGKPDDVQLVDENEYLDSWLPRRNHRTSKADQNKMKTEL